jgi:hypothetical protein
MYTQQASAPWVAAIATVALVTAAACDSTVTGDGGEDGTGGTAGSASAAGGASDQGDGGAGGAPASSGDSTVTSSTTATGSGSGGAANCTLEELTVTPGNGGPTDQCNAIYTCDNGVVVTVECDGENDGTYTSLCSCQIGSTWADGGLVEGEGEAACPAGFANCMQ